MGSDLKDLTCVLPRKNEPALTDDQIEEYMQQLSNWKIVEEQGIKQLERAYKFNNFIEALAFTNKVGELAEKEDHHPAIKTEWGKVMLKWWTHAVKGLHRNDFIMAAKSDEVYTQ